MAHPIRDCLACGQVDDHPRDVVTLPDGSHVNWHMDCHAQVTGCETCQKVVASAKNLKGDELREHIVANDPGAAASVIAASGSEA